MDPNEQPDDQSDDAAVRVKAEQILRDYNEQHQHAEIKRSLLDVIGMLTHTRDRTDGGMIPNSRIGLKVFIIAVIVMGIVFYGGFAIIKDLIATGS